MVSEAPPSTREAAFLLQWSPKSERWAPVYGPRNGKVVQRREGLRLHLPQRRWRGPFRPLHGDRGQRVQDPRRRRPGDLRDLSGKEGTAGGKRYARLIAFSGEARASPENTLSAVSFQLLGGGYLGVRSRP